MTQLKTQLPLDPQAERQSRPINPWLFVPVLYFMQSIPNILVGETFVGVFKTFNIENTKITFWTSIVLLPWTFKLFWGPFVDLNFTKRGWTVAMQVMITASLVLVAAVIPVAHFFEFSIAALFLIAMFSATHDIACDGLYLMSLDRTRQAAFSGVMATFSRLGRMFISFAMLFLAGVLQKHAWNTGASWACALGVAAAVYGAGMVWNVFVLPRPVADVPAPQTEQDQNRRNFVRTLAVIVTGVCAYFVIASAVELVGFGIFRATEGTRYDAAMEISIPAEQKAALAALPKPRLPINWHMTPRERNTQLGILFAGLLLIYPLWRMTRGLIGTSPMGEAFETYFRQPGFGYILLFIVFYRFGEAMVLKIIQLFLLGSRAEGGMGLLVDEVGKIYGISLPAGLILGGLAGGAIIARIGLRRAFIPLVICMHTPNLLYVWVAAKYHPDVSAFSWKNFTIYGAPVFVLELILAALLAIAISVYRKVWTKTPLVVCGLIGAGAFLAFAVSLWMGWLNNWQMVDVFNWPLYGVAFVEAFGYGFGFAGYFVYLMYVAQRGGGKFRTSHYAIGTGLGALFITFAGILSGIVQQAFGYLGFFIVSCIFTIPGTLTLLFIPMEQEETKSVRVAESH